MNDIYLKIKSIRLEKNLTQEDVSKKLGMAQSNYARMERGLSQITVERLTELAEIFEMTPAAIITYSENQGDFKEDAQYYYKQLQKSELRVKKLEKDIEEQQESDSNFYSNREAEKKKLVDKVAELKKEIIAKDVMIQDRERIIEKLEREMAGKNKHIDHLQDSNSKLLDLLNK